MFCQFARCLTVALLVTVRLNLHQVLPNPREHHPTERVSPFIIVSCPAIADTSYPCFKYMRTLKGKSFGLPVFCSVMRIRSRNFVGVVRISSIRRLQRSPMRSPLLIPKVNHAASREFWASSNFRMASILCLSRNGSIVFTESPPLNRRITIPCRIPYNLLISYIITDCHRCVLGGALSKRFSRSGHPRPHGPWQDLTAVAMNRTETPSV